MIEHLVPVRLSYRQKFRGRGCRKVDETSLYAHETVCIREVDVTEAPVAYVVSDHFAPSADFVVRVHDGGFWWPAWLGHALDPERFISLAFDGDESLVTALGVKNVHGRKTIEEFAADTPIRDLGSSTLDDARARLQKGASRTMFFRGRVLFEAGPPAFFRKYHKKHMVIGPLALRAGDYGNDGSQGCYVPGPSRRERSDAGGGGRTIGLDEIESERRRLPDGLHVPEVGQTIETVRDLAPANAAALFCEREFPGKFRARLANQYDYGFERTKLLRSLDPDLDIWVDSAVDTPVSTRWLLRRCARGPEEAFKYEFQFEAMAARAILRRLARYGLESSFDDTDEAALERLSDAC